MNAVEIIAYAARKVGYRDESVVKNYAFADVLDPSATTRQVALAAFTQTPPSYRSAALALVVDDEGGDTIELVNAHRALGAPLLFVLTGQCVSLWQVRSSAPPRILERVALADVPQLFERNSDAWRPDTIHRAKSIGAVSSSYQLDFVDLGLLPAIEGEIHTKLDRLLVDALGAAKLARQTNDGIDTRLLFRVVFRLLAAKVLQDRHHKIAANWDADDLASVMRAIESYYGLDHVPATARQRLPAAFTAAWEILRAGINFSNISADDLAFVYENTLVTPEARRIFGTHSTPRQVAEYVVQRLDLHLYDPGTLKIYEPFVGAGVFLVSALRHLRDLLPTEWSDQQRHNFLINHLAGDEIEPFACEVAKLSLILADYPNHNGWKIGESDLFDSRVLRDKMASNNVIVCNPPFESFTSAERARYELPPSAYSKPMVVLDAALDAHPLAIGFVLPRPFILESQFASHRRRIEKLYSSVELVELPDRTFGASDIEAAALIACDPRPPAPNVIRIRSTEITDGQRVEFLKTGEVSVQRSLVRVVDDPPSGDLWIPSLMPLWSYLSSYPQLQEFVSPHRGLEWKYPQEEAWRSDERSGFKRGLHSARQSKQFFAAQQVWLDVRPKHIRRALELPWATAKIIVNAARLSRGPWRIAAVPDARGLVFSQQFFGLWPSKAVSDLDQLAIAGILNGPVANAFLAVHSPANRIRVSALNRLPVPRAFPRGIAESVAEYMTQMSKSHLVRDDKNLSSLLTLIDAAVLEAYDLPPRLEAQLLEYFRGAERPVAHTWTHWDEAHPAKGLRLAERLSGQYNASGNWIKEVFQPLPEHEAEIFREYGE